jgi:hypothetical protein
MTMALLCVLTGALAFWLPDIALYASRADAFSAKTRPSSPCCFLGRA